MLERERGSKDNVHIVKCTCHENDLPATEMREFGKKSSFSEEEGEFGFGFAELEVVVVVRPSAVSKPSPGATAMVLTSQHLPPTPCLATYAGLSPRLAPLPEVHPQPPPYPSISRDGPSPARAVGTPRFCCLSVCLWSHVHTSPPPITTSRGGCHQAFLSKTPSPSNHHFLQSSHKHTGNRENS